MNQNIKFKYYYSFFLVSFLFFPDKIYNKKETLVKFKNEFKNKNICIYNIISLKRKIHKIVIFCLKYILT